MILRFRSGSVMPARRSRNSCDGVDEDERQLQALEAPLDLVRFVEPHDAVVDEDARQPVADRSVNQHRRDRRIDAAAEAADDAAAPDLLADARCRLFDERGHRPVAAAAADVEGEVPKDFEAAIGVGDFGMEEQRVEPLRRRRHRRHRGVAARGRHDESRGRGGDEVAVARPDAQLGRQLAKSGASGSMRIVARPNSRCGAGSTRPPSKSVISCMP